MQYDTYSSLLSAIQDAWHGHYALSSLAHTLSTHAAALSSLAEPAPSPSSRTQVESRSVRLGNATIDLHDSGDASRLGRRTVDFILSLSSLLHLDELSTVRLISHASATAPLPAPLPSPSSSSTPAAAATLPEKVLATYFTRRYNLLVALLDLLLMYRNAAFPEELLMVVDGFVGGLLRDGLALRVMEGVVRLVERVGKAEEGALREQLTHELGHHLRVLLALTRKHSLPAPHAVQLLVTLQTLSTQLSAASAPSGPVASLSSAPPPPARAPAWLTFACYSLLTSLVSALETKVAHLGLHPPSSALPGTSSAASSESELKAFIAALSAQGEKEGGGSGGAGGGWAHFTFQAAFLLAWALFLRRVKPLYPDLAVDDLQVTNMLLLAVSHDVSLLAAVHTDFLTGPQLAVESRREEVAEVWAELYAALVVEGGEELELLKEEEPTDGDQVDGYFYFLHSLAWLCRLNEANVSVLWAVPEVVALLQNDLNTSTSSLSSLLPSPLLPAYIALLSALTLDASGECAFRVYELLRGTALLSWPLMFGIFQQVINIYLPHSHPSAVASATVPPPSISARESTLLCSFLSLITSVLASADVQAAFAKSSEFRALDRLFALLGCRVDTVMKAHIVDALTAFARSSPSIAVQVWERMDRANVLPPEWGQAGGLQGLYYDLEEVESVQRRYPLTIAFSRLVLTLLAAAPLPSPSLLHYVTFVTQSLFLSLNDRQYLAPLERWKLTEAALATMALCAAAPTGEEESAATQQLGVVVAKEVLTGKETLVKLLEVVSRAYQLLEVEGSAGAGAIEPGLTVDGSALERGEEGLRAVEGSLSCALRLLWEIMSSEDDWVERVRREGSRAYTLSSLLFSHPQEILVIAHATAHLSHYSPSFATRTLSDREREARRARSAGEDSEEKKEKSDEDDEDDERGVIAYHSARIVRFLSHVSDARLAHLLLASRLAAEISRAFAAQLRLTQLPSSSMAQAETNAAHLARLELVRTLVSSIAAHKAGVEAEETPAAALGWVLLGFDVGSDEDMRRGRLESSDRRFALDAIMELVRKPSFAVHFPLLAAECYHLFSLLCSSPLSARALMAYLSPHPLFFVHLLHALPLTAAPTTPPTLPLQHRRFLLQCTAQQLFRSPSPDALLARLTRREEDGSLYLLSLLSSFHTPLPATPALPAYVGSVSLASCMTLVAGRASYHLPALYTLLTTRASLPPHEAQRLCESARVWNVISERVAAVVEAGEAWAALVVLLASHLSAADISSTISAILGVLVSEDPTSLALSSGLSAALLQLVPHSDGGELHSTQVADQLMDALVNHQQPLTRCNVYALLLLYVTSPAVQHRERVLGAMVGQGGRVMSLLVSDATEGGLVVKAIACALLSHVVAASASSPALPLLRQASLLSTLVAQLVKRDDDLRMSVLSTRPSYLPALHQYTSVLTLCTQLSCTRAGRELLIDADVVSQLGRLTVVDVLVERDLHAATAPPSAAVRYFSVLVPLLRLMSGLLWSRHSSALTAIVRWLRSHQELITAVVKERRVKGVHEQHALQLMAQLLERVEAASKDVRRPTRDAARAEPRAPSTPVQKENVAVGGVTGHLRGLLKYVGVSLPAAGAVQPSLSSRESPSMSLVPVDDGSTAVDRDFLTRYDRLLTLHLHTYAHAPVMAGDGEAGEEERARTMRELQEETVCSVLSLCCLRVEYGRGKELLFASALSAPGAVAGGNGFDSAVHLGTLVDVVERALHDLPRAAPQPAIASDDIIEAAQRLLHVVERALLLLLHHVQMFDDSAAGRRMVGEGWRDAARDRMLPVLERADRVLGDGPASAEEAGGKGDGAGALSTALVVSDGDGSKRGSENGPRSLFVSAFTRRLRKLLM